MCAGRLRASVLAVCVCLLGQSSGSGIGLAVGPAQQAGAILEIPDTYPDLKTALRYMRNDDTVYFRAVDRKHRSWESGERGFHSWQGRAFVTNEVLWRSRGIMFPFSGAKTVEELIKYYEAVDKKGEEYIDIETTKIRGEGRLRFTGDPHVKTDGQLILCPKTTGEFIGPMSWYLLRDIYPVLGDAELRYVSYIKAAISIQGTHWLLRECQVRTSGGTALRTDYFSKVRVEACQIGGVMAYDIDKTMCCAARGVSVTGYSRCVMSGTTVEYTHVHKKEHKGGCGAKVCEDAELICEDCLFHSHQGVAFLFDEFDDMDARRLNLGRITLRNCEVRESGIGAFCARGEVDGETLCVSDTKIYGPVWANDERPGELRWQSESITELPGEGKIQVPPEAHRSIFVYKAKKSSIHYGSSHHSTYDEFVDGIQSHCSLFDSTDKGLEPVMNFEPIANINKHLERRELRGKPMEASSALDSTSSEGIRQLGPREDYSSPPSSTTSYKDMWPSSHHESRDKKDAGAGSDEAL